jgi:large subunit ribosomal protein L5
MGHRIKRFYRTHVVTKLFEQFQYKNIHQVPSIKKIVVTRGLGRAAQNAKVLDSSLAELSIITTQLGVITRAKKSYSGFKVRKKMPVGILVTLRGDRIYAFFDRLLNLALPRIRDFQGVSPKRFDGLGNYNLGFEEQLIFPEVRYDQVDHLYGIGVSIVTSSKNDKEGKALIKILGIPFKSSHTLFILKFL